MSEKNDTGPDLTQASIFGIEQAELPQNYDPIEEESETDDDQAASDSEDENEDDESGTEDSNEESDDDEDSDKDTPKQKSTRVKTLEKKVAAAEKRFEDSKIYASQQQSLAGNLQHQVNQLNHQLSQQNNNQSNANFVDNEVYTGEEIKVMLAKKSTKVNKGPEVDPDIAWLNSKSDINDVVNYINTEMKNDAGLQIQSTKRDAYLYARDKMRKAKSNTELDDLKAQHAKEIASLKKTAGKRSKGAPLPTPLKSKKARDEGPISELRAFANSRR